MSNRDRKIAMQFPEETKLVQAKCEEVGIVEATLYFSAAHFARVISDRKWHCIFLPILRAYEDSAVLAIENRKMSTSIPGLT